MAPRPEVQLPTPTVMDHVSVGEASILQSDHVSEGPGRIANAPVPSIYHDDRGEIHRLRGKYYLKKLMQLIVFSG
jgi:hypothetical protein